MTKDFKVLLFSEFPKLTAVSGLGKAILHEEEALKANGINYTKNPRDDFDIAHINTYGTGSYLLAKYCKKHGKKVVYHAHSTEEDFRNSFVLSNQIAPHLKKWLIKCYSLGDVILTPTPYSKSLLENYGLKNITALSNGVDTDFFVKNEEAGKKFRKDYNFTEKDKIILGIGLYLERKGILDFIALARRFPDYKFIWFGSTPPAVIPRKIRTAILNKPKNLTFPGHVPAETIRAALSGCDIYVFPTLEETEGIPAIEACSVGTPMIVRDIPVFSGWLKDGKNTYKAKTLDDFAEKIEGILSGKLKSLKDEARKVAIDRDVKKVGKDLVSIYESLL